jgi:thiol:disulfide interchange protein
MKTIAILGVSLLAVYGLFSFKNKTDKIKSNADGIHFFKGSWNDALDEAKKQDKIIFLDVYATWFGPCNKMKKTTFNDEIVGTYFNKNFINVAIDGETPEGQLLIEKYAIRGYPSLLFVNANGTLKAIKIGYHSSELLMSYGKKNLK